MNRKQIASLICRKIENIGIDNLKHEYLVSGSINYLVIDDLLPLELATQLSSKFPPESQLSLLDAPQEKKFTGLNFLEDQRIIEECIYAFQQEATLNIFSDICSIPDLVGDAELYAGGISSMSKTCFLNPHIDNSHDRLRNNYRRLNLLYYVSEDWCSSDGGQLVLYPNGLNSEAIEIDSVFNRLVIMRTDNRSLHAVKRVNSQRHRRKCISNYYFSSSSPLGNSYYHSTSFRGFPGENKKDLILRLGAFARTSVKSLTGNIVGKYIKTDRFRDGR